MSEMEEKLTSILGNPQMMQQIMAMAQAIGNSNAPESRQEPPPKPEPQEPSPPGRTWAPCSSSPV